MCLNCRERSAVSDSGYCGPCLRAHYLNPPAIVPTLGSHAWAGCEGLIAAEQVGPDAMELRCMECGAVVGRIAPQLLGPLALAAGAVP
jgi:hypothetical protein